MVGEHSAVGIIQRPAIDKQLVEEVAKYARPEHLVLNLDNQLIPRTSKVWSEIEKKINDKTLISLRKKYGIDSDGEIQS